MITTFFTAIIAHGDTIIVAIVAVILGWDRLSSGSGKLRKEINEEYKERNIQLEERLELEKREFQEKIQKMQDELTHVHNNQLQKKQLDEDLALIKAEEEKKKVAEFAELKGKYQSVVDILQGRNVEMDEVIKNAPATFIIAADTNKIVKETYGVVKDISGTLDKIALTIEKIT